MKKSKPSAQKYHDNFDDHFPDAPIPWYENREVEKRKVLPVLKKTQMENALKKLSAKWFSTNIIEGAFIVPQLEPYHSYKIIIQLKMEVPFKDGNSRRMIELKDTKYLWRILLKGYGQLEDIKNFKESLIQQIRDLTHYNIEA